MSCKDGYCKNWVFHRRAVWTLSCCACDIGNAFLYGKTKKKVYITAGPEFGIDLHGKNLIIDKSLYAFVWIPDFCC
jgi:hypothetical protein